MEECIPSAGIGKARALNGHALPKPRLFFHQTGAALPRLSDFFADAVITVLELVEYERIDFFRIDFVFCVENFFVRDDIDDFTDDAEAAHAVFDRRDFAFEREREFFDDGSIHFSAFIRMQSRTFEFVGHRIARRDAEKISRFDIVEIRNAERKSVSLFDIFGRFVRFIEIERDHIFRAHTAPRHIHDVDAAVFVVCRNHKHRHGKHIGMNA